MSLEICLGHVLDAVTDNRNMFINATMLPSHLNPVYDRHTSKRKHKKIYKDSNKHFHQYYYMPSFFSLLITDFKFRYTKSCALSDSANYNHFLKSREMLVYSFVTEVNLVLGMYKLVKSIYCHIG